MLGIQKQRRPRTPGPAGGKGWVPPSICFPPLHRQHVSKSFQLATAREHSTECCREALGSRATGWAGQQLGKAASVVHLGCTRLHSTAPLMGLGSARSGLGVQLPTSMPRICVHPAASQSVCRLRPPGECVGVTQWASCSVPDRAGGDEKLGHSAFSPLQQPQPAYQEATECSRDPGRQSGWF